MGSTGQVARQWYDDRVDATLDLPVAPAVQQIVKDKNKTVMITAAAVTEFTSRLCSPVSSHWTDDTHTMAASRCRPGSATQAGSSFPSVSTSASPCRHKRRA